MLILHKEKCRGQQNIYEEMIRMGSLQDSGSLKMGAGVMFLGLMLQVLLTTSSKALSP